MPTYAWFATFRKDFDSLSPAQQAEFLIAISHFVDDIEGGSGFRKGLRVKGIQGANGIFEMTWANNGRATFEYGPTVNKGELHIIWRRIGTHSIFDRP